MVYNIRPIVNNISQSIAYVFDENIHVVTFFNMASFGGGCHNHTWWFPNANCAVNKPKIWAATTRMGIFFKEVRGDGLHGSLETQPTSVSLEVVPVERYETDVLHTPMATDALGL